MRLLLIILGFICAITGLFFSIFSMGLITIIPVLIAFMVGLGAVKLSNQQIKKTT